MRAHVAHSGRHADYCGCVTPVPETKPLQQERRGTTTTTATTIPQASTLIGAGCDQTIHLDMHTSRCSGYLKGAPFTLCTP